MVNILTHWNGFVQRKRSTPLGTSELALYYVLMEHWNGLGRPEWLSVAAGVLQAESGLSDTTFKRARQRLCRKGYINYRQGTGRSAARYHLLDMGAAVPPRVACPQGKHPSPHTVSANEVSGNRCDGGAALRPSLALPQAKQASPHTASANEVSGSRCDGGAAVRPSLALPRSGETGEPAPGERDRREAGADVVGGHTVSATNGSGNRCDGLSPVKRGSGETKDMGVDGKVAHKTAHKVAHKMAHKVAPLNKDKEKEKENQHPLAGMLETVEWKNYAQMRLKMKRPLEPRAVHMALDKLLALAPGDTELQRRILDQSTFFYWKDLYALERRGAQDGAGAAGAGQAAQERMAGVDINELARRSAEERAACGRGWLAKQTGEYGEAVPPRVACHPSPHTVSTTNGSGNRCDGFYAQEHVVRLAAAGCERDRREA